MNISIAMLIFGNGHGMAAPHGDQTFLWLVDRRTERGRFYTWIGGLGAQLASFECRPPLPNEARMLKGVEFVPFSARRHLPLAWYVSWAVKGKTMTIEEINSLRGRLQ